MSYTEKTIRTHLQKLNDNWNDDYWIFVVGGTLTLMRKDKNGNRSIKKNEGVDQSYILTDYVKIDADGGGW